MPAHLTDFYGELYTCNHLIYSRCTLFRLKDKGLAVIQQYYNPEDKSTVWREIEPGVADRIYLHKNFMTVFEKFAGESQNGLFPTLTVRQLMWEMRMKPLKREVWETYFDHKPL